VTSTKRSPKIRAAGGVVLRTHRKRGLQVLIAHRPKYRDWTLPKGRLDKGEDDVEAALREVWEETGLRCLPFERHGLSSYRVNGNAKHVAWYTMEVLDGTFEPNDEVDQIRWVTLEQAERELTYRADRLHVAGVSDDWAPNHPMAYVARHAHAGDRSTWEGDDAERPLSDRGWEQARSISKRLRHLGITRLISSPALRCIQTLEPLAKKLDLEIETHWSLAEGASPKATAALLSGLSGRRSAVSSHGDVIPAALDHLATRGMQLHDRFDCKKGSVWALRPDRAHFTDAWYVPPGA
jgi:8-oxo-dGTP pyrophosphatase MutT (NUDIX family)